MEGAAQWSLPILIVDDEADIRSLLEINLRREGYETVSAASATEALEIVGQVTPKCILLDMMLPDMSHGAVQALSCTAEYRESAYHRGERSR